VAVSVIVWPRMGTVVGEAVTVTVMTFAELLPPQPFNKSSPGTASKGPRKFTIFRNLIPTITPTKMRPADQPPANFAVFCETRIPKPSSNARRNLTVKTFG
jgi:hypothetical protein